MKKFFENLFNKKEEVDLEEDNSVLISAISLMIEVSMADQSIDDEEIESLKKTLSEKFDVEGSEIENLIIEGKETQKESTSLYDFTRVINDDFSFEEKFKLIKSMWEIAFADGNIDKYEEYVIRKVSDLIYISHPDFIESKQVAREEYENRKT